MKGLEILLVKMATGGATPRKFAEKIAMHNQKGAEENAEFQKIMSEIARVKGNAAVGTMQSPRVSLFYHVRTRLKIDNSADHLEYFRLRGPRSRKVLCQRVLTLTFCKTMIYNNLLTSRTAERHNMLAVVLNDLKVCI